MFNKKIKKKKKLPRRGQKSTIRINTQRNLNQLLSEQSAPK